MPTPIGYLPRIADKELATRLASTGAVVIEGPKACGKTETARRIAASEVLLDIDENARQAMSIDPKLVLNGAVPRLIDEWQIEPVIWNHIRRMVDDRGLPGQFILTGSAVPADDITRHTGAGRLTRLRLRPMTLFETGQANGAASMGDLLSGVFQNCPDPGIDIADIARCVVAGGWPAHCRLTTKQSIMAVRDYLEEITRVDMNRVDQKRRDPAKILRVMQSLARNVATPVALRTLAVDAGGADGALNDETVRSYLKALVRLMIIEDQPPWAPHLRSRSILRNAPKRHFVDPSLAAAALRATPERLFKDLNLLGCLFESMVIRDLRVYAQANDAKVLHYRDNTGLEVDAVVEAGDGRWTAYEIKLGAGHIDAGAINLLKFAERVDTGKCGSPALLGVIVGTGYGYMRKDGVAVIPVGALGP
jgi:predicted AAA+ superfamily ATPase